MILYTDGLSVFKNPQKSIWPVILSLCELPPGMRQSKLNKIIAGVWFGNGKPNSTVLFSKLVDELKYIEENPLNVSINGKSKYVNIQLNIVLVDTPAKATVLDMVQFNGYYGCPNCKQKGRTSLTNYFLQLRYFQYILKGIRKFNKTIYPLTRANVKLRNNENFLDDAEKGTSGVKRKSILTSLLQFPDSAPLDYMHLVFEGIFLNMLNHWFDTSNNDQPYYISNFLTLIFIFIIDFTNT